MVVINSDGVRITTSCETSASTTKSWKPCIGGSDRLMKKWIIRINTPQASASATLGVSSRSRSKLRSHKPMSSRSLSRNSTLSELN